IRDPTRDRDGSRGTATTDSSPNRPTSRSYAITPATTRSGQCCLDCHVDAASSNSVNPSTVRNMPVEVACLAPAARASEYAFPYHGTTRTGIAAGTRNPATSSTAARGDAGDRGPDANAAAALDSSPCSLNKPAIRDTSSHASRITRSYVVGSEYASKASSCAWLRIASTTARHAHSSDVMRPDQSPVQ